MQAVERSRRRVPGGKDVHAGGRVAAAMLTLMTLPAHLLAGDLSAALVSSADCTENALARNDDGSTSSVDLPFAIGLSGFDMSARIVRGLRKTARPHSPQMRQSPTRGSTVVDEQSTTDESGTESAASRGRVVASSCVMLHQRMRECGSASRNISLQGGRLLRRVVEIGDNGVDVV